jgi:hypothetical protein
MKALLSFPGFLVTGRPNDLIVPQQNDGDGSSPQILLIYKAAI